MQPCTHVSGCVWGLCSCAWGIGAPGQRREAVWGHVQPWTCRVHVGSPGAAAVVNGGRVERRKTATQRWWCAPGVWGLRSCAWGVETRRGAGTKVQGRVGAHTAVDV
ncbi:hypothetical protein K439DRAFT_1624945 [Ramaria rubella]|nr:hypothetical protein K439DRAFT_1624945 [Ramaria rubella]